MKYYGIAIATDLSIKKDNGFNFTENSVRKYIIKWLRTEHTIEQKHTVLDRIQEALPEFKYMVDKYRILL